MFQDYRMRPVAIASVHPSSFATVEKRVEESTEIWARDLASLFGHAKERFGDVSWETQAGGDRIWGHKAIIYARAPKTFKDRYFLTRPFSRSPTLRSSSPASSHHPTSSSLFPSSRPISPSSSRGPSSLSVRTPSFSGSGITIRPGSNLEPGETLRLTHGDTPELFQAQLEWLYTGEGFGDVVEWISQDETIPLGGASIRDSQGRRGDQSDRRDKLGQDLTYMWRSKLYVDVRIRLDTPTTVDDGSSDSDESTDSLSSTAVFTAHRFILVSRSPYFASLLLNTSSFLSPSLSNAGIFDINLPTPPFTPASLHFCLGYIYAGHLDFSNRTFDLTTVFQIYRAALYLQLDGLMDESIARIVWDFCHGLDYNRCHCKKCMMRVGRVWRFALEEDVGNVELAKAAREFLVFTWGDSWGKEVGLSTIDQRNDLIRGVQSTLSAKNVISAFRSIGQLRSKTEAGIRSKGAIAAAWVDPLGEMVDQLADSAKEVLIGEFVKVAEGDELWKLLDGGGFSADLLEGVLKELVDFVGTIQKCIEAPRIYQTIVSSILLRTDPEAMNTILPLRSNGRQLVESAKEGIVAQIKRRWLHIRDAGGFQGLEIWAIKEIADAINVSDEELFSATPTPRPPRAGIPRTTSKALSLADTASLRSNTSVRPLRTATHPPTLVENNAEVPGLRRLRLSSSASSSSAVSVSSRPRVSSALATTPPSMIGPRARSPTAARRGNRVNIGVSGRSSQSVAEGSRGPSRTGEPVLEESNGTGVVNRGTMSGGIRPLVSRGSLASTSVSNMREKEKNGSTSNNVASSSSLRAVTPSRTNPSTPIPSGPTTPTSTPNGRKSSASVRPTASGSKLPLVAKPLPPLVPTARTRAASLASTRTSRSTNKVIITPVPTATPKTSGSQVTPPSGPSKSAVNGSSTTTSSRIRTQSQSTTTSTVTRSRPASNASTIRRPLHVPSPPVPPVPKIPSTSAQKSRLVVQSPSSPKRTAGPNGPIINTPLSSSSSTTEDPDTRTPETSDIDDPPSRPTPKSTQKSKLSNHAKQPFPPSQAPRPIRKVSTSSTRSHEHPSSAFDPPRRQRLPSLVARPAMTIKDGSRPFTGKGVSLRVGIPCIVSLEGKRARFRAQVKYLGYMDNSKDPWVGIESEDLGRFGVETLPAGSQGGYHYFDLTPPLTGKKAYTGNIGLGADLALTKQERTSGRGTQRSVSPFVPPNGPGGGDDWMVSEDLRALFVRPREVVYVVGAE